MTPEQRSLAYAENLGLNSVYTEAIERQQLLGEKLLDLNNLRNRRRSLEGFRVDKEMEVAERVYLEHANESQAARDRLLKVEYSNDGDIRETRDELVTLAGEIDAVEADIDLLNQGIKIAVARLHELGGYFQFMAVVKQANEARKTKEDKGPW